MRLYFSTLTIILISCSLALSSEPPSHPTLEARGTDDEGWIDITVGVRMKRDESSSSPHEKRSEYSPTSTPVLLTRNPKTGKLAWPRSFSEALTLAKRHVHDPLKRSLHHLATLTRRSMKVKITWYKGYDLLNPSCFPDSAHWAPTDDSMVAATTIQWEGKPPCGSFVRVQHHSNPDKHIVVRIVDSCAGCAVDTAHLDLTTGAFEKLYDQDVGMVEGLKAKIVPCPKAIEEDWNDKVIARYGPRKTIGHSDDDNQ